MRVCASRKTKRNKKTLMHRTFASRLSLTTSWKMKKRMKSSSLCGTSSEKTYSADTTQFKPIEIQNSQPLGIQVRAVCHNRLMEVLGDAESQLCKKILSSSTEPASRTTSCCRNNS